jgi:hypothetical protein
MQPYRNVWRPRFYVLLPFSSTGMTKSRRRGPVVRHSKSPPHSLLIYEPLNATGSIRPGPAMVKGKTIIKSKTVVS